VADIKNTRLLLESVTKSDPKNPNGWIALSRLEGNQAGNPAKALCILEEACEICAGSEDVWLERVTWYLTVGNKRSAQVVLSAAVRHVAKSGKGWVEAVELEEDPAKQKSILKMALEKVPGSNTLWKMLVRLESEPHNARLLLRKAVELVPRDTELWIALAKLEPKAEALQVLRKALIHN